MNSGHLGPWLGASRFYQTTCEFHGGRAIIPRFRRKSIANGKYTVADKEKLRIRQRWADGEGWWRYFERHEDGQLTLRARLATAPPLETPFAKAGPQPPKIGTLLRMDKRLSALVQVESKSPSLEHVLERVKAATGVDFHLAPGLESHAPDLGYITPPPKGYLAWQLLEHVATKDLKGGKWEKTESGYRLVGQSLAQRRIEPAAPVESPDEVSALTPWLLGTLGVLLVLVGILGGRLLYLRVRRKPQP